ncbi:hypothetical protein HSBAA_PA_0690 (plasmid) [Vreelandella sulfidaeris]|uniref:Transcriptional repressor RcnR to maintain nickel and cobalt homeostasis n=1 Tax=Vreelandella sulfidaeris TaxID=115553 RepID=A0A455UGS3_9GAMM|nr:hypothetical protein HSBAA_PA_0690 [Halomonas sulfidaeris]
MHTIKDKAKLLTRVRRIQGRQPHWKGNLIRKGIALPCCNRLPRFAAVNGLMAAIIEGHLTDHIVREPELEQRQQDLDAVLQVIKSYLK